LLDAFDRAEFDGVIVRQERSRRGGEPLAQDAYAWFAAPSFQRRGGAPLPLANLAPPCGVRTLAIRALDMAKIPWCETFIGGGLDAVAAATSAGLAVAVLARRIAPAGCIDVGETFRLPRLPRSRVVLYSRVSDARGKDALRVLSAAFRGMLPS
jgi:DNA-binding transcriptional LysR family regulator